MREITVALAGNPNAGKTTVFNALTGSRQHVGNYAGVTVDKVEGIVDRGDIRFRIVDLPGTYSLSANSPEEVVARNYLVMEKPDMVIQVVDASNLERNLYLATQIMELGVPLVVALNMSDVAKAHGIVYDLETLQALLKTAVVPTVGNKQGGMRELLDKVAELADKPVPDYPKITYPKELEKPIAEIDKALTGKDRELANRYPPLWLATRLFENDPEMTTHVTDKGLHQKVKDLREEFHKEHEDLPEVRVAEAKYGWISGLCAKAVEMTPQSRVDISDRVDTIILHRLLGLPIFLFLMYVMFNLVFTVAAKPMEWIEGGFTLLGSFVRELWPRAADSPLRDLVADGMISGVGGVLVFVPNIILLFLAIAFLEGTGYMARAAFIMDRFMSKIGLHGKSFIPMLLGFGCTVPAIMGTRTLENRNDRFTTILVLPFMSCGARLPIYTLLIPAFFPLRLNAWMLWCIYVIGIAFAILGAKLLRATIFTGGCAPFVMELPPYRMPTFRVVFNLMWDRASEYCRKAGTIILGASILLWAMTAYPQKKVFDRDYDNERETARESYTAGVGSLASLLDVSDANLTAWANATNELREARNNFWPREAGMQTAIAANKAAVQELFSKPDGARLARFVEAVQAVDTIEDRFEADTEDSEEDSHIFRTASSNRDRELAMLGLSPDLMTAVTTYRDTVRAGFTDRLEEINNSENSESLAFSIAGRLGKFLEPVLKPIGFDWRFGTAIIGSFAAKEVFVAQMGIVFAVGEGSEESETLREQLVAAYSPLQAFCMMIYALLSLPCVATIAITKRETRSWRYAVAMMVGMTVVAYVTTFIVFQAGSALGIGTGML